MMKKILTIIASIALSCLITTTSFANYEPSEDCLTARATFFDVLEGVQVCKSLGIPDSGNILNAIRASKRACLKVAKAICLDGSYADANPVDIEICGQVDVDRDEDGNIVGGEILGEEGYKAVVVIVRDDEGNIISITVYVYDAEGNLVETYNY